MPGSKKNRQKKGVSTSLYTPTSSADDELMDELIAQLDSRDQTVQAESAAVINEVQLERSEAGSKQDARSRFRARQARKTAALEKAYSPSDPGAEVRLKKEAVKEQEDIERICQEQMLQIHEVNPDGHCLYSAVADQLGLLGILPSHQANYMTVRKAASQYMLSHPADFIPFLEPSADGLLATESGIMSQAGFEQYCATIHDTAEWGGEPEILALSRTYKVPIHVIQGGHPSVVIHDSGAILNENDIKRVVRISYHRRMYGLGEHYNSLRPKSTLSQFSHKMHAILST